MPIRYKVVKKKTRASAVINGKSHYARKYLPHTTVFAEEGTIGILTFKTKYSAQMFADQFNYKSWYDCYHDNLIVLKVETIGRGKAINWVSAQIKTHDLEVYYKKECLYQVTSHAPHNTIAYPGVKVLE